MPNYPTSAYKQPNGKSRSWVILYEDGSPRPFAFKLRVSANLMSEATARAISYIEENALHLSPYGYTLTIIRDVFQKVDFNIE